MKTILKFAFLFLIAITFIACSTDPPRFRVSNERTQKANVQIKTVANTININDVLAGQITEFRDVTVGMVTISAEIQGENNEPKGSFNAANDVNYTIVLVNSTPPSIRIDQQGK